MAEVENKRVKNLALAPLMASRVIGNAASAAAAEVALVTSGTAAIGAAVLSGIGVGAVVGYALWESNKLAHPKSTELPKLTPQELVKLRSHPSKQPTIGDPKEHLLQYVKNQQPPGSKVLPYVGVKGGEKLEATKLILPCPVRNGEAGNDLMAFRCELENRRLHTNAITDQKNLLPTPVSLKSSSNPPVFAVGSAEELVQREIREIWKGSSIPKDQLERMYAVIDYFLNLSPNQDLSPLHDKAGNSAQRLIQRVIEYTIRREDTFYFHDLGQQQRTYGIPDLDKLYLRPLSSLNSEELIWALKIQATRLKRVGAEKTEDFNAISHAIELIQLFNPISEEVTEISKKLKETKVILNQYFSTIVKQDREKSGEFWSSFNKELLSFLRTNSPQDAGTEGAVWLLNISKVTIEFKTLLAQIGIIEENGIIALKVSTNDLSNEGRNLILARRAVLLGTNRDGRKKDDSALLRRFQRPFLYSGEWDTTRLKSIEISAKDPLIQTLKSTTIVNNPDLKSNKNNRENVTIHVLPMKWVEGKSLSDHIKDRLNQIGYENYFRMVVESGEDVEVIDNLPKVLLLTGVKLNPNILTRISNSLQDLHQIGMSHGDVNFRNIIIGGKTEEVFDSSGRSDPPVYLIDFGAKTLLDLDNPGENARNREDWFFIDFLRSLSPH